VGSTVKGWFSAGVDRPEAKIFPEYREVTRGEEAAFDSRSTSVGGTIRQSWLGPKNLKEMEGSLIPGNTLELILTLAAAALIFLTGYTIHRRRKRKRNSLIAQGSRFRAAPHHSRDEQFIGSDHPLDTDYELQIISSIDHGKQEIVTDGPLTTNEADDKGGGNER
jgi:hypothetical protein